MNPAVTLARPNLRTGRRLVLPAVVALVAVAALTAFGATRLLSAPATVAYRTQAVQRANVTKSVAVSGAVNASSQSKLSFSSGGQLTAVLVSVGQTVNAGEALAKLDDSTQQVALRQAGTSLALAQARYENVLGADDVAALRLSLDSAQKNLDRLVANYRAARTNLDGLYNSARADRTIADSSFISAQTHLRTIQDDFTHLQVYADLKPGTDDANAAFGNVAQAAVQFALLDSALNDVQNWAGAIKAQADQYDAGTTDLSTYALAQASYTSAIARAQAAVDATNQILGQGQANANAILARLAMSQVTWDFYANNARTETGALITDLATTQASLQQARSKLGSLATSLSTIGDVLVGGSLANAQNGLAGAKQSLQAKLDSHPSDVQSALASVQSAQASYDNARNALANLTLTAPVAGVVSAVSGTVGEQASGTIVTLTSTGGMVLHGTIGEADVAQLRLGQSATITVDAVGTDKRFTGKVTSLDPVATVSNGVPVYGVDVTLDVSDPAIRAGMSATANVIIASQRGVLVVPNTAIKNINGQRGVQVLRNGEPVNVTDAQFGLSNDQVTEVKSGLAEGDLVLLPSARGATTNSTSTQRAPGGGVLLPGVGGAGGK